MTDKHTASQDALEEAEVYTLLHRGHPGDVEYYLEACTSDDRMTRYDVLELGCGDGRIAATLAEAGHRVIGLELHPGMLALAHRRRDELSVEAASRLQLVEGDMRRFELDERFDCVLLPYNTLFGLLDDDDLLATLQGARDHLKEDGRLIFDVYNADPLVEEDVEAQDEEASEEPEWLMSEFQGDTIYDVYEQERWKPDEQRFEVTYTYEIERKGRRWERRQTIVHRYLTVEQLEERLERCDLKIERIDGDFDGEPFDEESDHVIIWACRGMK